MGRAGNIGFGIILIIIGLSLLNYVSIPAVSETGYDIEGAFLGFVYFYGIGWLGTIVLGFITTVGFISIFKSGANPISTSKK